MNQQRAVGPKNYYSITMIRIGINLLGKLNHQVDFSQYSKVAVLTDSGVAKLWLPLLLKSLKFKPAIIIIPAGEQHKNLTTLNFVWRQLLRHRLDRRSLLINLGGGVVSDLGGLAAATFMRGIDFINIPTTLLAQVDAASGGKTAIDFAGVKNLIGTFTLPKAIIIDAQTLSSLPRRQLVSGWAEIIKHGLIKDRRHWQLASAKPPSQFSQAELIQLIKQSVKIKTAIVAADAHESGLRKLLNFGHTIGHALEALSLNSQTPLLHGEAVSLGMAAAAKLSQLKGFLTEQDISLIELSLKRAGLPIRIKKIAVAKILNLIRTDKKTVRKNTRWTLLESIGQAIFNQTATKKQIVEAILWLK